jgi:hypothetical protein
VRVAKHPHHFHAEYPAEYKSYCFAAPKLPKQYQFDRDTFKTPYLRGVFVTEIPYLLRGSCGNIFGGGIAVAARVARHNLQPRTNPEPTQETP